MRIQDLTLDGNVYASYASIAAADELLAADASFADAWLAADESVKIRSLVSARERLDLLPFKGLAVAASGTAYTPGMARTTLAWPRTGLVYPGGFPVPATQDGVGFIPVEVSRANIRMAGLITASPDQLNENVTFSGDKAIKRAQAGSVEVEYMTADQRDATSTGLFRPSLRTGSKYAEEASIYGIRDVGAYALLRFWLIPIEASAAPTSLNVGGFAYGTGRPSSFE